MSANAYKLLTVRRYLEVYFDRESAPHPYTVRRWLESGELPGVRIGGRWYVQPGALPTGNALADKVLAQ